MRHALIAALALLLAAPMALAQAAGYRIQPGDQLAGHRARGRDAEPPGAGAARRPHLGAARRARSAPRARPSRRVERAIADRLASNFAVRPNVFVSVTTVDEEDETFPIYVLGRVGDPGLREVEIGTTLLQAVALAGGFDRFAATKRIQLRRTDPADRPGAALSCSTTTPSSAARAIQSMITLREGDVILVPERRLFE